MVQIPVALSQPYSAFVEAGLLARAGALVADHLPAHGRLVVVTSPQVRRHWGATLDASLAAAGLAAATLELPDGETHKTLADLVPLAEAMAAAGAGRDALVLALGGGVVGDVAGLLASLYMRGVDLIQIPTTLVAMVDSALGGKTGVNLAAGKNLVGSFHHPRAILVDPALLATLPGREYRSGLAEAIKYGIIGDRALFDQIETSGEALSRRDPAALAALIATCLRHKAAIVAADERESGLRRVLNFGHTLGHALESATDYGVFLHGEAVAWGMIAAGQIAVRLGNFSPADADRMNAAILARVAPLPAPAVEAALLLRHAASDKKARAGVLRFILPTAIGQVEVVSAVPADVITAAWNTTQTLARELLTRRQSIPGQAST